MIYTIIVEWFNTDSETDGLATYEAAGLINAENNSKYYLRQQDRPNRVPTCVRIEDADEIVVAVWDWINGRCRRRQKDFA